jgi:hypothetical protein
MLQIGRGDHDDTSFFRDQLVPESLLLSSRRLFQNDDLQKITYNLHAIHYYAAQLTNGELFVGKKLQFTKALVN